MISGRASRRAVLKRKRTAGLSAAGAFEFRSFVGKIMRARRSSAWRICAGTCRD